MTGIILAGGKSSRMGFNKAFIEVNGVRIIERTVNLFKEIFNEVMIITNTPLEYEEFDVRTATDLIRGAGSVVFIQASSMPPPAVSLLQHVICHFWIKIL